MASLIKLIAEQKCHNHYIGVVLFRVLSLLLTDYTTIEISDNQVFQRRINGSLDFYKKFHAYENGFGSAYGEFWLGMYYCLRAHG